MRGGRERGGGKRMREGGREEGVGGEERGRRTIAKEACGYIIHSHTSYSPGVCPTRR